jgi:hypothetical protein
MGSALTNLTCPQSSPRADSLRSARKGFLLNLGEAKAQGVVVDGSWSRVRAMLAGRVCWWPSPTANAQSTEPMKG